MSPAAAAGRSVAPPPYVADAERFWAQRRSHPLLRLLGWCLRCGEDELAQAAKKLYCLSRPEDSYQPPEGRLQRLLGASALPLRLLLKRRWRWTAEPAVEFSLETIDRDYFQRWFGAVWDALPASKRVTPRHPEGFGDLPASEGLFASVRLGDVARLALAAPLWPVLLLDLNRRAGLDLGAALRQTLSIHATFRGYFSRYPCRHFVTFDDESNPPARHIAFRQLCPGRLVVVQNGERSQHPHLAYGSMDDYYLFGTAYGELLRSIGVKARFEPVGALCLNERWPLLKDKLAAAAAPRWDVLMVDQGVYPNGLDERGARSLETIMQRLAQYHDRRPDLRLAYQLRHYGAVDPGRKDAVLAAVRRHLGERAQVLDNAGKGESYLNLLQADVTLTFESTLGFEALALGRKALFVNFSGDPLESLCEDERFQHEDPGADYGRFEAKLDAVRALRLDGPPECATRRHHAFDGRVQERLAAAVAATGARP